MNRQRAIILITLLFARTLAQFGSVINSDNIISSSVYSSQSNIRNDPAISVTNSAFPALPQPSTAPVQSQLSVCNLKNINYKLPLTIPAEFSKQDLFSYLASSCLQWNLLNINTACSNKKINIEQVAIKQHNTSFYLTAYQYFLTFQTTKPQTPKIQRFTAIFNKDCTWSLKTQDALYVSLDPNYNYIMLNNKIGPNEKFNFLPKDNFLKLQSASSPQYFWTIINGIARIGRQQASRITIQLWTTTF